MAFFLFVAFVAGSFCFCFVLTCLIPEVPQFLSISCIQLLKDELGRLRKQAVGGKNVPGLFVLIICLQHVERESIRHTSYPDCRSL